MKRLIKLLSIFGVLIILGSCSSSKSISTTVNTNSDGKIAAIISVDREKFVNMAQTAPDEYNTDITMYITNITAGSSKQYVKLDTNITLDEGSTYKLSGYYDNINSVASTDFTPVVFTATIYSSTTSRTIKITMKNGTVNVTPI